MQHVGVTSVSEVHKYPADIGKYEFFFNAFANDSFGDLRLDRATFSCAI